VNAKVTNLVGRPRGGGKPDVPGIEFLIILGEFVGQDDFSGETHRDGTLEIIDIDVLPIWGAYIYIPQFMRGSLVIKYKFVCCVVEDNFVTPIVVCVIRVIGFGCIEETEREDTTRGSHVHIEFSVPRVRELDWPIDPSIVEVYVARTLRGVTGDARGGHVSTL
jgi:hypothetical protein